MSGVKAIKMSAVNVCYKVITVGIICTQPPHVNSSEIIPGIERLYYNCICFFIFGFVKEYSGRTGSPTVSSNS